jgi:hypothetical protein
MNQLACAATCTIPAHHLDTCNQPNDCRGCLPGHAADGLVLCTHHTRLLPELALNAAKLYGVLGSRLLPAGGTGPRTSGSKPGAPTPDDTVMQTRADIQRTLVVLAQRIADQRGVTPPLRWSIVRLPHGVEGPAARRARPTGHRMALAQFVGKHAEWLAAQDDAGHICDLLVHYGRIGGPTWRLAYPHRTDRLYVGDCPLTVTNDQGEVVCGERLHQVAGQPLITCRGCGTAALIEQWERWLYPDGESVTVDAYAGARALARAWYREVDAGLIRVWTVRRKVVPVMEDDPTGPEPAAGEQRRQRIMRDERGRTLYRLADLRATATKLWGEAPTVRRAA